MIPHPSFLLAQGQKHDAKLTIAIPTFNRNDILRENLAKLVPQLTAECSLLIVDNCSAIPVQETLADLLVNLTAIHCRIVRNAINIGGGLNVMRCIELCETNWLWILCDDDSPLPNAVSTIFEAIRQWPEALFVNYSTPIFRRTSPVTGHGLPEFMNSLGSFGNTIFASTGVYRADRLRAGCRHGAHFLYGRVPHFVTLLASFQQDSQFCFLHQAIVDWTMAPPNSSWPIVEFSLQLPITGDFPLETKLQKQLRELIALEINPALVFNLLLHRVKTGELPKEGATYLMDQIYSRGLRYHPHRKIRLISWLCTLLMRVPSLLSLIRILRPRFLCLDQSGLQYWAARERAGNART